MINANSSAIAPLFGCAALLAAIALPHNAHAEDSRPIWLGLSTIGVVHHNSQSDINQALLSSGYSTISTNQPIAGLGVDFGIARWRLTWDTGIWGNRSYSRLSDSRSFSVSQANVSLDTGFNLIQYRGFSLFPMLGLAGGDLRLDVEPSQSPLIRNQIGAIVGTHELRQNTWSTRALLGFEQRVRIYNRSADHALLIFGLRLGYQKQFSHSDWILDDPDFLKLHDGPAVDVSGPFVRFAIGIIGSPKTEHDDL